MNDTIVIEAIARAADRKAGGWPNEHLKLAYFLGGVAETSPDNLRELTIRAANSIQLPEKQAGLYVGQLSFWLSCKPDQLLPVLRVMHEKKQLSTKHR